LLVLTTMFGASSHGVVRWVAAGPLMVQTSLILLPALLMMFARRPMATVAAALVVAAVAVAVQPDRAMASSMVAGMAMLWLLHRHRQVALVLGVSAFSLMATLVRSDTLPPVRFTEGVFTATWQVHPLLGIAVAAGGAILLLPAAAFGPQNRDAARLCAVFGAVWLAIIVAALVGNYPTPLVGYGGSAIIGYLLSAGMLPPRQSARDPLPVCASEPRPTQPDILPRLLAHKPSPA
jgi:cell division protein FtsW (lipid II flippase)